MKLLWPMLCVSWSSAIHHDIASELSHLRKSMAALREESSKIHDDEKSMEELTNRSLKRLASVEKKGENEALKILRKNDIGFDMVEQKMASKMH